MDNEKDHQKLKCQRRLQWEPYRIKRWEMAICTQKIGNPRTRIYPLIFKDWSLGVDTTKFSNQSHKDQSFVQQGSIPAKRKILEEYSFKDRSFKDKNWSFPLCNGFFFRFLRFKNLDFCERQIAFHLAKARFFWILKRPKLVFFFQNQE